MLRPTVHVVDDDRDICSSLSAVLETAGFAVETYLTAEELLERSPWQG
jgi:FixJ family two-component response regulator